MAGKFVGVFLSVDTVWTKCGRSVNDVTVWTQHDCSRSYS